MSGTISLPMKMSTCMWGPGGREGVCQWCQGPSHCRWRCLQSTGSTSPRTAGSGDLKVENQIYIYVHLDIYICMDGINFIIIRMLQTCILTCPVSACKLFFDCSMWPSGAYVSKKEPQIFFWFWRRFRGGENGSKFEKTAFQAKKLSFLKDFRHL